MHKWKHANIFYAAGKNVKQGSKSAQKINNAHLISFFEIAKIHLGSLIKFLIHKCEMNNN